MAKDDTKNPPQELQIVVPQHVKSPLYANTVNINASDDEVTFNFAYINTQDNPPGTVVSRVVIPRSLLKKVSDSLIELLEVAGRK